MQMLLRFLLLAVFAAAAAAQVDADAAFEHRFGPHGVTGSFLARLSKYGAGLVYLQAADHYDTLAAAREANPDGKHYLLLVENGGDHALRLFQPASSAAFPADPALDPWTVETSDDQVKFTLDGGAGLVLEKVLRHDPKQRGFVLEIALHNVKSDATGTLDLVLGGATPVLPHEASLFGTVAVAIAVPRTGDRQSVGPAPGKTQVLTVDPHDLSFAGSTNRFFGAFLWPRDDAARAALSSLEVDTLPPQDSLVSGTKANSVNRVRYGLKLAVPARGAETRASFGLYFGPKAYSAFATLPEPERFAPILDVDLKAPCCYIEMPGGRQMAKVLLWVLTAFHRVVGNWGVAIMMLTIVVRGLLSPVNFHMQKSMRAYSKRMAVLKPKMDAMKVKYGDDQRAYQQAMLAFQRENKVIPPLGGCLPMFLVMPIYLGLFTALRTAYDVRQQPFIAWIEDLSRPDALFPLPFFPHQFNLLPLVWIVLMVIQMLRQPLPTDPQQRQTMMIMRYMPLMFGVMLYNYAAALLVYMVTSMLWTFVEGAITKKILGPIDPNVAALTPQPL